MDKLPIKDIQETIGYQFKNKRLLEQAFVRSSYANEHPDFEDNEKLEFFGDAALDYYVTRCLYEEFSDKTKDGQFKSSKSEQELTEIKSYNVDTEALAHCIEITGFQDYLLMNESDIKNNVQNQQSVMADLFEAILGAVVVDSDWDLKKISIVCKSMMKLINYEINYIKWLRHWCAERGYIEPRFMPKIDFFRMQLDSQPYINSAAFQLHSNPLYIDGFPFNSKRTRFEDRDRTEQITGAYLYIKELDLHTDSDLRYEYAAYMECAKKAYDYIQDLEIKEAIGEPNINDAVNQLNVLYQKGYIHEPLYDFGETYDENGNPIWTCYCDIYDLEDVVSGESSVKKEAKKEAAYKALC